VDLSLSLPPSPKGRRISIIFHIDDLGCKHTCGYSRSRGSIAGCLGSNFRTRTLSQTLGWPWHWFASGSQKYTTGAPSHFLGCRYHASEWEECVLVCQEDGGGGEGSVFVSTLFNTFLHSLSILPRHHPSSPILSVCLTPPTAANITPFLLMCSFDIHAHKQNTPHAMPPFQIKSLPNR
jgi:hypothetical protein